MEDCRVAALLAMTFFKIGAIYRTLHTLMIFLCVLGVLCGLISGLSSVLKKETVTLWVTVPV